MEPPPVKVLLVEDSPSDAALLREALNQTGAGGFQISLAESWAQAADHLRQDHFDVLLLDLSLPDSTGRDSFLRARAAAPHLPILVLTGVADETVALEALRLGIQDYLVKGQTDGRQTARAIHYAIERKRIEEALQQAEEALRQSELRLRAWNQELEQRVAARTAELEETISDLEDFSHSITHDLRAPLRAMRGFGQILQQECHDCARPSAQEHIQRILTAAARMDKLIQDVLQYSRLARSQLSLAPVDVQNLLRGIIESYPSFQSPDIDIEITGAFPRVLGNEAALTQCFSNLLGNAIKFVPHGTRPRVRIWAETRSLPPDPSNNYRPSTGNQASTINPAVRLWFADNGVGIPPEAQARIFKLFQRLDKSYDGTGVGLTVVRKAVEKMGGRVGLESEPGQGSRFWLELQSAP